jgi:hypothetical protein
MGAVCVRLHELLVGIWALCSAKGLQIPRTICSKFCRQYGISTVSTNEYRFGVFLQGHRGDESLAHSTGEVEMR